MSYPQLSESGDQGDIRSDMSGGAAAGEDDSFHIVTSYVYLLCTAKANFILTLFGEMSRKNIGQKKGAENERT